MITTAQLFKAISDQNRIRILNMLKERILCVCEIRTILGLANSTVSQHLRILKENGFIEESKDGKWVNYSLNIKSSDYRIIELLSLIPTFIKEEEEKIFQTDLRRINKIDRNIICGIS